MLLYRHKEENTTTTATKKGILTMKLNGFFCRMYGKDCFFETNQIKRTKNLALTFINKVQNKMNRFNHIGENEIEYVQKAMRAATFKIRTIENGEFAGLSYYEIEGEDFNCGCDACENPMEYCVIVN